MSTSTLLLVRPVGGLLGSPDIQGEILDVRADVRDLRTVLTDAGPNGRDYYPQGPGVINKAIAFHSLCGDALRAVSDELYALIDPDPECREPETRLADILAALPAEPLFLPTVHLNGTSSRALVDQGAAVFRKAAVVEESFRKIVPNGRDFADAAALEIARAQHATRVAIVKRVGDLYLLVAKACKV